jgi:hypothetical protein
MAFQRLVNFYRNHRVIAIIMIIVIVLISILFTSLILPTILGMIFILFALLIGQRKDEKKYSIIEENMEIIDRYNKDDFDKFFDVLIKLFDDKDLTLQNIKAFNKVIDFDNVDITKSYIKVLKKDVTYSINIWISKHNPQLPKKLSPNLMKAILVKYKTPKMTTYIKNKNIKKIFDIYLYDYNKKFEKTNDLKSILPFMKKVLNID